MPPADPPMLVPVTAADDIVLDLRYASADNLTGRPIYRRPIALLHPSAHALLLAAARRFSAIGLRVKLFDAFRPLEAQQALWGVLPNPRFVANPADGSSLHTRGVAVDVTLVDEAGVDLPMGSGFDAMTPLSAHDALDLPGEAIRNRALLLGGMAAVGWQHIASEWWHYQLAGCEHLPQLGADDVPDGPM